MSQVPAQNIEAEREVLGALLVSASAVEKVVTGRRLSTQDFYFGERHGAIFDAVASLAERGDAVDALTAVEELRAKGRLDQAGGREYVHELAETVTVPGNALHHADIVRRHAAEHRKRAIAADLSNGLAPADAIRQLSELTLPDERDGASRLLSIQDLAQLPPPRFLLSDFIRRDGFNVLYGPSGAGKSFLAIDWSLCIAHGLPFYGQEVERGPSVYIAAEGAAGLHSRIQAWIKSRGVTDPGDLFTYPEAVNFFTGDVGALVAQIDGLSAPPVLIVVDTAARCMVGGDENSARDMGLFIQNVDNVCKRYSAAAMVIHHTGKSGELERGSSALRGAADTMVSLKPDGAGLRLSCEKQKDAAEFEPWFLHLAEVDDSVSLRLGSDDERLSPQALQILEAVSQSFEMDWTSASKVKEVSNVSDASVYRALKALVDGEFLESRQAGKQRREYAVTPKGAGLVADRLNPSHETVAQPSQSLPSSRGETVEEMAR